MMRNLYVTVLLWSLFACCVHAQTHQVLLSTNKGDIRISLYDDTPGHRDNFLRLVREGYYNGIMFHRVIRDFMVQAGDSAERAPGYAAPNMKELCPSDTIPAEIVYPKHYHKRGVLAAAREGDDENPSFASSSTHFYIVWGRPFTPRALKEAMERGRAYTEPYVGSEVPDYIVDTYENIGGTPHLDGGYTVFGEVVEGMEVVDAIQRTHTDYHDRPKEPVVIVSAKELY